jgi:hypothetical protein
MSTGVVAEPIAVRGGHACVVGCPAVSEARPARKSVDILVASANANANTNFSLLQTKVLPRKITARGLHLGQSSHRAAFYPAMKHSKTPSTCLCACCLYT